MKKYIFTFASLFYTTIAFCQQDSLLKTFKFRNSNYRAINLNTGGGSQFDRQELGSGTFKNTSSYGNFSANYYRTKSTDKLLLIANAGLGTSFSANNSSEPTNTQKSRSFNFQPQVNVLNKWFKNKRFLELGVATNAFILNGKTIYPNQPTSKSRQNSFSVTINTGIGIGRLENITDMQNALWLSKALQKANSLTHSLSATELNELGRTITAANNTRILDDRKRTQFILATVDNYFQQKGLVAKNDITYFSNLNDILFFAFNTPRLSGTEKFIRLSPSFFGNNNNYDRNLNVGGYDKSIEKINNRAILLSTGINKYTPHNLIHQNNYGASLNLFYTDMDYAGRYYTGGNLTSETLLSPVVRQAFLKLFYEHAIYPNTRTIILFNVQSQGGYEDVNKQNSFFVSANGGAIINYFISYRIRFFCSAGVYYSNNVSETADVLTAVPNRITLNTNAGFTINI